MIEFSVKSMIDRTPQLEKALKQMRTREVAVGYPESKKVARKKGDPMSNATLAYIHDKGSPAARIPARPFMNEGIEDVEKEIDAQLAKGAALALDGNVAAVDDALHGAGLEGQAGIKNKIVKGPFKGLAKSTLRSYPKGGAKGKRRRDYGLAPLKVTGQLQGAVNYAVRDRRE